MSEMSLRVVVQRLAPESTLTERARWTPFERRIISCIELMPFLLQCAPWHVIEERHPHASFELG